MIKGFLTKLQKLFQTTTEEVKMEVQPIIEEIKAQVEVVKKVKTEKKPRKPKATKV